MSEKKPEQPTKRTYVATQNGTLSSPFRYVRKGERIQITSASHPIKSKWLVPEEDHKERPGNLPIMSNLKTRDMRHEPAQKPKMVTPADKDYERVMGDIKRKEALEDAQRKAALSPTPPAPQGQPGGEGDAPKGTGAQEVI